VRNCCGSGDWLLGNTVNCGDKSPMLLQPLQTLRGILGLDAAGAGPASGPCPIGIAIANNTPPSSTINQRRTVATAWHRLLLRAELSPTQTNPPNQKANSRDPSQPPCAALPLRDQITGSPCPSGRLAWTPCTLCVREPRGHTARLVRPPSARVVVARCSRGPAGYRRLTLGLDSRHGPPPLIHVKRQPGR